MLERQPGVGWVTVGKFLARKGWRLLPVHDKPSRANSRAAAAPVPSHPPCAPRPTPSATPRPPSSPTPAVRPTPPAAPRPATPRASVPTRSSPCVGSCPTVPSAPSSPERSASRADDARDGAETGRERLWQRAAPCRLRQVPNVTACSDAGRLPAPRRLRRCAGR
ncbi:hypothetical protein [Streptomyces sp. NPDC006739]|uniref:hypothetical protein n=1 Tax=Streptomyces sp. NPDC006739 TaxID=3364763 RepID=UPI003673E6C0